MVPLPYPFPIPCRQITYCYIQKSLPKSLHAIKEVLTELSEYKSSQCTRTLREINSDKSSVIYSKICSKDASLHDNLGFPNKSILIVYQGIPITGKKKAFGQCWKVETHIANWKMLSRRRREIFIESQKNPTSQLDYWSKIPILASGNHSASVWKTLWSGKQLTM